MSDAQLFWLLFTCFVIIPSVLIAIGRFTGYLNEDGG